MAKQKSITPDSATTLSFEQSLNHLEQIIEDLEKTDLTLDDALKLFEQGIVLIRNSESHLNNARGKVTELLKGENGELVKKVLGTTLDSFIAKDVYNG